MEGMGSKLKHYTSFSDYIYAQKNLKCLDGKMGLRTSRRTGSRACCKAWIFLCLNTCQCARKAAMMCFNDVLADWQMFATVAPS